MTNKIVLCCQNCDWQGESEELHYIENMQERVAPGELAPEGQCPLCGALVAVADEAVPDYVLEQVAAIMTERNWSVSKPR